MATNYDLLATATRIQVLSPTLTMPIVDATLQSKPTGMIFNFWVAKAAWDAGTAPALLEGVAQNAEHLIEATPAISGFGFEQLENSGLLKQYITYTVAATAPGGTPNALTVEVDIPISDLDQDTIGGTNYGLDDAEAKIQAAYDQLVAAAAG